MILQALNEYYERMAADPESGIAPFGFEWKEIPFVVVIDREGKFVTLEDTRSGEGKQRRAKAFLVPQGVKRAVGIRANLLWDTVEYALGANPRNREDIPTKVAAFIDAIRLELPDPSGEPLVESLLRFLETDPAKQIEAHLRVSDLWKEAFEANANVTFRVEGDANGIVAETLHQHIARSRNARSGDTLCLVSGRLGSIEPTHPSIKGVRGAQSSGASLVSFNCAAYTSFGKRQNFNAPISSSATFAYTTALNTLLGRDSTQRFQVGDATVVFWSDRRDPFEDTFACFFAMPPKDDPGRDTDAVRSLYRSIDTGASIPTSDTQFSVLGLAPNAARLSVRFWYHGTVRELGARLKQHFDDLTIVRGSKDVGRDALFWLLTEISTERKVDNIPPNIAGGIVRAVLQGTPYPATLLQQAVRRNRAEQNVTRLRAGILKACLNRFHRTHSTRAKEIQVSLDLENTNPGYRLGRLFAVLEKIQEDANPGLNATIRDRFYGAASANPVTVFPQLLKLKNHHLKKLDKPGLIVAHERRLGEIFSALPPSMPGHLSMDDQARFAIGYYHQRQALFTKSPKGDIAIDSTTENPSER